MLWDSNPFVHFSVKKVHNHYAMKNIEIEQCANGGDRHTNSKCTFKLYLKCCVDRKVEGGEEACKVNRNRDAKEEGKQRTRRFDEQGHRR